MSCVIDNPMCNDTCANCRVVALTEENEQLRRQLAAASTSLQAANASQVRERQIRFSDQALCLELAQENARLRQMINDLRDRVLYQDTQSFNDYPSKERPNAMIYVFNDGIHEDRYVSHVFEAPEGVHVNYDAFLHSLGCPKYPEYEPELGPWLQKRDAWAAEKRRIFAERGIDNETRAYREWLEQHPQVRSLLFEEI